MSEHTLVVGELVGTRPQATALTAALPEDLTGAVVLVDLRATKAAAPSFVDQLVRELLVERRAARVVLGGANPRIAALATRAAGKHDRADRLETGQDPRAA